MGKEKASVIRKIFRYFFPDVLFERIFTQNAGNVGPNCQALPSDFIRMSSASRRIPSSIEILGSKPKSLLAAEMSK